MGGEDGRMGGGVALTQHYCVYRPLLCSQKKTPMVCSSNSTGNEIRTRFESYQWLRESEQRESVVCIPDASSGAEWPLTAFLVPSHLF